MNATKHQMDMAEHNLDNFGNPMFKIFLRECEAAQIVPTQRQWRKYQQKEGRAWDFVRTKAGHNRDLRKQLTEAEQELANRKRGVYEDKDESGMGDAASTV